LRMQVLSPSTADFEIEPPNDGTEFIQIRFAFWSSRDSFDAFVLSRETIMTNRRLDNLVSRLREKLGDGLQFIFNPRCCGYKLLEGLELVRSGS